MAGLKRFEDVRAWQIARQLAHTVHVMTDAGDFLEDPHMRDAIRDSATQAMHGVAEGFAAGSNFEFIHYVRQSQRATAMLQSQMYAARDCSYINKDQFRKIFDQAEVLKAQLLAFIVFLNKSQKEAEKADSTPVTNPFTQNID